MEIPSRLPPTFRPEIARRSTQNPSEGTTHPLEAKNVTVVEEEARRRIENAQRQVLENQKESDFRLNRIREDFDLQKEVEAARQSKSLEDLKIEGYEQIRDLKKQIQAELHRIRREGETQVSKLQDHYRVTTNSSRIRGEQALHEIDHQNQRKLENQKKEDEANQHQLKATRDHQIAELTHESALKLRRMDEENQKKETEIREAGEARAQSEEKNYNDQLINTRRSHADTLHEIQTEAQMKLNRLQNEYQKKVSLYENQQQDPFYNLRDLGATLEDQGDAFILTANIPEHEQKHVSAVIKGDHLVLVGYRRNQEVQKLDSGQVKGTSSFQTFHESFPLNWPVDDRKVSRESKGDQIIIRVPKKVFGQN